MRDKNPLSSKLQSNQQWWRKRVKWRHGGQSQQGDNGCWHGNTTTALAADRRGCFSGSGRHTTTWQSAIRECNGGRQEEMTAADERLHGDSFGNRQEAMVWWCRPADKWCKAMVERRWWLRLTRCGGRQKLRQEQQLQTKGAVTGDEIGQRRRRWEEDRNSVKERSNLPAHLLLQDPIDGLLFGVPLWFHGRRNCQSQRWVNAGIASQEEAGGNLGARISSIPTFWWHPQKQGLKELLTSQQ